jgi:hypothetical protein
MHPRNHPLLLHRMLEDEHDVSHGPQNINALPWPQTRWSTGQVNVGSEDSEEFDDATPHGSQEGNASEEALAQGHEEIEDALLDVSQEEPPDMLDDDEDEEIELLPGGVISSDDDDIDGFVCHRNQGDLKVMYSRDFVDSTPEALTMRHLATRKPKLRSCDACRHAKALRARHFRTSKKAINRAHKFQGPMPENFGDQVILEHIIARNERNLGFAKQTCAFTFMNRAIDFRWGKGFRKKTGEANLEVMRKFQGPDPKDKIKYIWSDAAPEISYATKALGIRGNHDASVPGDSQGNGVTENNNRDTKMGTASLLTHAGVPLAYWPLALPCYCFGHNAAIVDGTSPYRKRFGENFDQTKMFPFGAEVEFIPSKITGDHPLQFSWDIQLTPVV